MENKVKFKIIQQKYFNKLTQVFGDRFLSRNLFCWLHEEVLDASVTLEYELTEYVLTDQSLHELRELETKISIITAWRHSLNDFL